MYRESIHAFFVRSLLLYFYSDLVSAKATDILLELDSTYPWVQNEAMSFHKAFP